MPYSGVRQGSVRDCGVVLMMILTLLLLLLLIMMMLIIEKSMQMLTLLLMLLLLPPCSWTPLGPTRLARRTCASRCDQLQQA